MKTQIGRLDLAKSRFCVCRNLRSASRAVTQLYDEMLKPGGLRATQLGVMTTIANFGSVTINRLAQMLVMDRTTLTRNLKLLEKQGLIKTTPGEDRRTREVTLTDKGQQVLAQALPLWEKAQERVVKAFGAERWNATMADLSDLVTLVS